MTTIDYKSGDVLFWKSRGAFWDRFIGLVSPGFSHVAIYLGDNSVLEARAFYGVRKVTLDKIGNPDSVIRLLLDPFTIEKGITDYGLSHIGEYYSIPSGVLCGLLRLLGLRKSADKVDKNWFCSELTAYVLRFGMGVNIMTGIAISDILPDDVYQSLLGIGEQVYGPSLH